MENFWYILTILGSMLVAGMVVLNQVAKKDPLLVVIYRGFGVALALFPFALFFPPINSTSFYVLCIIQGCIIGYFDNRVFAAADKFGSRITSLTHPISIVFTFFIWFAFDLSSYEELMQNPLRFLVVFCSLAAISFCIFSLKKSKASLEALVFLMPSILSVVAIDIIGKQIMLVGKEQIWSAVFYYALFTALFSGFSNLIVYVKQKKDLKQIFDKKNLLVACLPVVLLVVPQNFLKSYSQHLVSNPAYVSAILYSAPLWVLFINSFVLRKDLRDTSACIDKRTIFILVASVVVLILAS